MLDIVLSPSMQKRGPGVQGKQQGYVYFCSRMVGASAESIEGVPACRQVWMAWVLAWLGGPKRAATAVVAPLLLGPA